MRYRFQDPISGLTHLAGALLSAGGMVYLACRSQQDGAIWHTVSFSIFGASLILLYFSSALYHLLNISPEARLVFRRIDHTMIFLLIAGTYTPFCLLPLRGAWGFSILGTVWGLTLGGIVMSIVWIHAPRWLSTALYLLTGWVAIAAIYPLSQTLSSAGMFWLLMGGLFYTVGAVIYAAKWPDPFPPKFGFTRSGTFSSWREVPATS